MMKAVFDRKATLQKSKGGSKRREVKETSARELAEQRELKMIRVKNLEGGEKRKASEVKKTKKKYSQDLGVSRYEKINYFA